MGATQGCVLQAGAVGVLEAAGTAVASSGPDLLSQDLLSPDLLSPDLLSQDLLSPDLLSPDTAPPAITVEKGTVLGAAIEITFNVKLNSISMPILNAFSITGDVVDNNLIGIKIQDNKLLLTLKYPLQWGDSLSLTMATKTGTPLSSLAGATLKFFDNSQKNLSIGLIKS